MSTRGFENFTAGDAARHNASKGRKAASMGMTDTDVIEAIRRHHLKANIRHYPRRAQHWELARVDPGGTVFGPGPYVKLPVDVGWDGEYVTIRVYAPEHLRRRLARDWSAA